MLPFTREQFIAIFGDYNAALWPGQWVAYGIGLAIVASLWRDPPARDRLIGAGLALLWTWTGIVYHAMYFAAINRAALAFGALFVVQGLLLLYEAFVGGRLRFTAMPGWTGALGWAFIAYAAVVYPVLGRALGEPASRLPAFGITPCPLTLFTVGLLLLAARLLPRRLLVIPLLWSLVGGSAAWLLGVVQDGALLLGAVVLALLLVVRGRGGAPRIGAGRRAPA